MIAGALALVVATVPVYLKLGSEFMPPLEEGSILYMPTTMPGISITEAQKLLQVTDRIIKQFPEVDRVLGKAGRAETSTDPAPLSMLETVITLKPKSEWRKADTWYSSWAPDWAKAVLRQITPDHISQEELISQMNEALKIPGLANAWTMPIKGRIDMLSTGMRTPVGLKISGGGPGHHRGDRGSDRGCAAPGKGDPQRLCRAHRQRLFPRFRVGPGGTGPLRLKHGRGAGGGAEGHRRGKRDHHGGRAGALPGQRPLQAGFPERPGALGRVLVPVAGGQRQIPVSQLAAMNVTEAGRP